MDIWVIGVNDVSMVIILKLALSKNGIHFSFNGDVLLNYICPKAEIIAFITN